MVDDDRLFVYLQKSFLIKSGISSEPVIAYSGGEALKYLENISGDSTDVLLFLDINMPDMSGWEVLDKIKKGPLAEKLYVVIVTSSVNKSDKEKSATYNNIIGFLEKPVSIDDFKEVKSLEEISGYFRGPDAKDKKS